MSEIIPLEVNVVSYCLYVVCLGPRVYYLKTFHRLLVFIMEKPLFQRGSGIRITDWFLVWNFLSYAISLFIKRGTIFFLPLLIIKKNLSSALTGPQENY